MVSTSSVDESYHCVSLSYLSYTGVVKILARGGICCMFTRLFCPHVGVFKYANKSQLITLLLHLDNEILREARVERNEY